MEKVNQKQTNFDEGNYGGKLKDGSPLNPTVGSVVKSWFANNVISVFAALLKKAGKNDFNGLPETEDASEVADAIEIIMDNKIGNVKVDVDNIKNKVNNDLLDKNSDSVQIVNSAVTHEAEVNMKGGNFFQGSSRFMNKANVIVDVDSTWTFKSMPAFYNKPLITAHNVRTYFLSKTGGTINGSLTVRDSLTVKKNAFVEKDLTVENDATVKNDLTVENDATVNKNLTVENNATVKNDLTVDSDAFVRDSLTVEKNAFVRDSLAVEKNAFVKNDLIVENDATVENDLTVENYATVKNDLIVENDAFVENDLTVENDATVKNDLTVENDATVKNDLTVENDATVKALKVGTSLKCENADLKILSIEVSDQIRYRNDPLFINRRWGYKGIMIGDIIVASTSYSFKYSQPVKLRKPISFLHDSVNNFSFVPHDYNGTDRADYIFRIKGRGLGIFIGSRYALNSSIFDGWD